MEKGKDRASKLYFSDLGRAKELITIALRRLGIDAGLSEIVIEDPVVSFLDTRISMEKLLCWRSPILTKKRSPKSTN